MRIMAVGTSAPSVPSHLAPRMRPIQFYLFPRRPSVPPRATSMRVGRNHAPPAPGPPCAPWVTSGVQPRRPGGGGRVVATLSRVAAHGVTDGRQAREQSREMHESMVLHPTLASELRPPDQALCTVSEIISLTANSMVHYPMRQGRDTGKVTSQNWIGFADRGIRIRILP